MIEKGYKKEFAFEEVVRILKMLEAFFAYELK